MTPETIWINVKGVAVLLAMVWIIIFFLRCFYKLWKQRKALRIFEHASEVFDKVRALNSHSEIDADTPTGKRLRMLQQEYMEESHKLNQAAFELWSKSFI